MKNSKELEKRANLFDKEAEEAVDKWCKIKYESI